MIILLNALNIRRRGVNFVSCPTCGRTQIDLIGLAKKVEDYLFTVNKKIHVAVMGCVVNGIGEGKEADLGIAGGKGEAIIFKKGEIVRKIKEEDFYANIAKLCEVVSDRAIERAIHYFNENKRVDVAKKALQKGQEKKFIEMINQFTS